MINEWNLHEVYKPAHRDKWLWGRKPENFTDDIKKYLETTDYN